MTQMITMNLVVEEDLRMIQILVMGVAAEVVVPPILDPLVADLLEAHLVHPNHQTLPTILLSMMVVYNS